MDVSILAINLVNGFLWGIILGFAAVGLTLLWGVMKVVNLAQGEAILMGSYVAIVLFSQYGISPLIGGLVALLVGLAAGFLIYWALLHKLVGKVEKITLKIEMSTLLAMFALSIALLNFYYYIFGSEPRGFGLWSIGLPFIRVLGTTIRTNILLADALALISVTIVYLFLDRTILGKSIRAVMQDAQAASLVGINPVKIKLLTTVLGIGLTVFSGFMVLLFEASVTPEIAYKYAPLGFVVVVLGGLGSVVGSLVAGIIIGIIYGLSKVVVSIFNPRISDPVALSTAFIVLILILLFKPEGIFGRKR